MNSSSRRRNNDITSILPGSNNVHTTPIISPLKKSKDQMLRAHSSTFDRLVAVRTKLDKYITSVSDITSTNQPITHTLHEASPSLHHKPQPTPNVRTSPSPSVLSHKRPKSQKSLPTQPLDKITYQETATRNGNFKQKCSVEIWLPNVCADNENGNTSSTVSRDSTMVEKTSQPIILKSHRSSIHKISSTTINNQTKSCDEVSPKYSEPVNISLVQHDEGYLTDQPEQRSSSSKTSSTMKSNGKGTSENTKRSSTRRLSATTKDSHQSATSGISMASKNVFPGINQTPLAHKTQRTFGSSHPAMMHGSMKKNSKRTMNQKLPQTKQPFEKTHHHLKYNLQIMKDSTSSTSANHPRVAVRILLGNTLPLRSAADYNIIDARLLNRRPSNHQSSNSDIASQTHFISMIENYRNLVSKRIVPLPLMTAKETDDSFHFLQTTIPSRLTMDSDSSKNISSSSHLLQYPTNGTSYISKRSLPSPVLIPRFEQQPSTQPFFQPVQSHTSMHTSTIDVSTKKELVHLKYSKAESTRCHYLIPK